MISQAVKSYMLAWLAPAVHNTEALPLNQQLIFKVKRISALLELTIHVDKLFISRLDFCSLLHVQKFSCFVYFADKPLIRIFMLEITSNEAP